MKHATTKTTSTKTKAIAAVMATICAFTALSSIAITSASAATEPTAQVTQSVAKAASTKAYTFTAAGGTSYGYDFDFYVDSTCVSVKCKYDFNTEKYTFTVTGNYAGTANVELRYKTNDTTWKKHNVKLKVDAKGNVSKIG